MLEKPENYSRGTMGVSRVRLMIIFVMRAVVADEVAVGSEINRRAAHSLRVHVRVRKSSCTYAKEALNRYERARCIFKRALSLIVHSTAIVYGSRRCLV